MIYNWELKTENYDYDDELWVISYEPMSLWVVIMSITSMYMTTPTPIMLFLMFSSMVQAWVSATNKQIVDESGPITAAAALDFHHRLFLPQIPQPDVDAEAFDPQSIAPDDSYV